MQRIIIGTAGHVDHGKSLLVKRLTGVDPDRLPEEKKREMTIDLGFVFLPINDEEEVAIIDVPGHERFLRTMIAGAHSIRMVLFVIAADEGIMPQTIEHLDVLRLMDIKKGVVVITKSDRASEERIADLKEDIESLVKGTFLERAPIFTVSSVTNQGIEELKNELKIICSEIELLSAEGIFRCPIDRIFTMRGFGTIVAGTVISGSLKKSETVEILPIERKSRIRNLQVHNQSVEEVFIGQRAAFNLLDITTSEIYRGCELSILNYLIPTQIIDTKLSLLPNVPRSLRNNVRIHFHKGTVEVMARAILLDKKEINPGGQGLVQFRLEKPIVGERKERFVIRSYSPMKVIGGGRILELYSGKRGIREKGYIEYLQKIEKADGVDLIEVIIQHPQQPIAHEKELVRLTNLPLNILTTKVQNLLKDNVIIKLKDNSIVHRKYLEDLKKSCLSSIEEFIKANPLKRFMKKSELAGRLKVTHLPLLEKAIEELEIEGRIELKADGIRIVGIRGKLPPKTQRVLDVIVRFVLKKGYKPFKLNETIAALPDEGRERVKDVLDYLLEEEIVVKISEGTYLHKQKLENARQRLIQYLDEKGQIRAVEFMELLGISRRAAREILDFFFTQGVTIRVKGTHRLKSRGDNSDRRNSITR